MTTIFDRAFAANACWRWQRKKFQSRKFYFLDLFTFLYWINASAVDLLAFSLVSTRVKLLNQHKMRIHQGVKRIFNNLEGGCVIRQKKNQGDFIEQPVKCTTKHGRWVFVNLLISQPTQKNLHHIMLEFSARVTCTRTLKKRYHSTKGEQLHYKLQKKIACGILHISNIYVRSETSSSWSYANKRRKLQE